MKKPFQRTIAPEARPWLGRSLGFVSLLWLCAFVYFIIYCHPDGLLVLLWALFLALSLSLTMYTFSLFCPGERSRAHRRLIRIRDPKRQADLALQRKREEEEREEEEWAALKKRMDEKSREYYKADRESAIAAMGTEPTIIIDGNQPGDVPLSANTVYIFEPQQTMYYLGNPYTFDRILDARLSTHTEREDDYDETIEETDTGDLIGRAAVGHLAFGKTGAVVGALSGRRRSRTYHSGGETTKTYTVFVTLDDLNTPSLSFCFEQDEEAAREALAAFRVMIRRGKGK